MNIKYLLTLLVVFFIGSSTQVQAQKKLSPSELLEKGEVFYENEKFGRALPYFLKYQEFKPKDLEVKLKIGVCYLETNRPDQAMSYLEYIAQQKNPEPISYLHLARSYHNLHQFSTAIKYYKEYLAQMDGDEIKRNEIKDEIKRCANGLMLLYREKLALVENLGDQVNTSNEEFSPIMNDGLGNTIYFSSMRRGNVGGLQDDNGTIDTIKGHYRSDIFTSKLVRGKWTNVEPLGYPYNSNSHDVVYGVSENGRKIYYGISNYFNFDYGNIVVNNFLDSEPSKTAHEFSGGINSNDWDGNAYFFKDSIVLFASDRPGGFGGKDIYISFRNDDGSWGEALNLGPRVNSPYHEDSPFLASDGATLYFSSNSTKSVGGFDIFKTTYDKEQGNFVEPLNLGFHVNSAADDNYFKLSQDGLRAFFASSRADGFGGHDIYVAYFKKMMIEQLNISGDIAFRDLLDREIIAATTDIEKTKPTKPPVATTTEADYPSFSFSPLFYQDYANLLIDAPSVGELNKMIKLMQEYPTLKVELTSHTDRFGAVASNLLNSIKNAESIAEYLTDNGVEANRIVLKGVGENYPIAIDRNADGSENPTGRRWNRRIEMRVYNPASERINIMYKKPAVAESLALNTGDLYNESIKGLTYKIQIKALSGILDDPILEKYGDAMVESTPLTPIMRYTIGLSPDYESANSLLTKLVVSGFKDAFIAVYIDGERMKKEELKAWVDTFPDLEKYLEE